MLHLDHIHRKSLTHSQAMQKILILCQYINCQNNDNYSISGSLSNCYRDEVNDSAHETDDNDNKINKTMLSKSFEYKTKIIGGTPNNNILDAEVVVSLK